MLKVISIINVGQASLPTRVKHQINYIKLYFSRNTSIFITNPANSRISILPPSPSTPTNRCRSTHQSQARKKPPLPHLIHALRLRDPQGPIPQQVKLVNHQHGDEPAGREVHDDASQEEEGLADGGERRSAHAVGPGDLLEAAPGPALVGGVLGCLGGLEDCWRRDGREAGDGPKGEGDECQWGEAGGEDAVEGTEDEAVGDA